jgi:hypothetical protein
MEVESNDSSMIEMIKPVQHAIQQMFINMEIQRKANSKALIEILNKFPQKRTAVDFVWPIMGEKPACNNYVNGFYADYESDCCENCGDRKGKHKETFKFI